MAKKEKKEKGFMESVHDGYIRGSMGGEEDTSQARTVTSPEPLPDEIKKFRKLYILGSNQFDNWNSERGFHRMAGNCCIYLAVSCMPDRYICGP